MPLLLPQLRRRRSLFGCKGFGAIVELVQHLLASCNCRHRLPYLVALTSSSARFRFCSLVSGFLIELPCLHLTWSRLRCLGAALLLKGLLLGGFDDVVCGWRACDCQSELGIGNWLRMGQEEQHPGRNKLMGTLRPLEAGTEIIFALWIPKSSGVGFRDTRTWAYMGLGSHSADLASLHGDRRACQLHVEAQRLACRTHWHDSFMHEGLRNCPPYRCPCTAKRIPELAAC